MIRQNNKNYFTIADAAEQLGVTAKTVREYVMKGIISTPPEFDYGVRRMFHFPSDYMKRAKAEIEKHKKDRANKHKRQMAKPTK